jgi:hypothetical protein
VTYTNRWQVLANLAYALDGSPDYTLAEALDELAQVFPVFPDLNAVEEDYEGYAVGRFIASLRQHLPRQPGAGPFDLPPANDAMVPALCALVLDHIERSGGPDSVSENHRRYYDMLKAWIHSPGVLPDSPSEQHEAGSLLTACAEYMRLDFLIRHLGWAAAAQLNYDMDQAELWRWIGEQKPTSRAEEEAKAEIARSNEERRRIDDEPIPF